MGRTAEGRIGLVVADPAFVDRRVAHGRTAFVWSPSFTSGV
jgi:hypothetical protein